MIALNQFNIKSKDIGENEVLFEFAPLPKGYGYTLGNIFRRILLSSIPGSAISGIKIEGVTHEYSSLKGLKDDVLTVVLSVKNVIIRSNSEETVELEIDVVCEDEVRDVKASDISKNSLVEVINPDYVITTLTKKGDKFSAKILVDKGVGYRFPDQEVRKELGMIPIDPTFSPVTLVNYEIVSTRVGEQTDLDQLNLKVKTNGSVTPREAFHLSANILLQTTSHLFEEATRVLEGKEAPELLKGQLKSEEEALEENADSLENRITVNVNDLNLSTRLTNALLRSGFDDLGKLEGMTREEIENIRGMGAKSVTELLEVLQKYSIKIL